MFLNVSSPQPSDLSNNLCCEEARSLSFFSGGLSLSSSFFRPFVSISLQAAPSRELELLARFWESVALFTHLHKYRHIRLQ